MKEGRKSRLQLHEERKIFVEEAMREGVHEKMGRKAVDIGLLYTYNDDLTLSDISRQIYPQDNSGRVNTSLHWRRFIRGLHARVSYSLASRYSVEDLLARKPTGEISIKVREEIIHGATDRNAIIENTGLSREQVGNTRKVLKDWGIDTKALELDETKKLRSLEQEQDDAKLQQVMKELPRSLVLREAIESKKKKRIYPKVFTTLRNVTAGSFYFRTLKENTDAFVASLRTTGIPFRIAQISEKQRYIILLEKHRQRVLDVFEADPSLERFKENPVKMACGDKTIKLPNTTELSKRGTYTSPHKILREMGIRIGPTKMNEFNSWLFRDDCPIPIFYVRSASANRKPGKKYSIELSRKEEFRRYVLQRIQELKQQTA